MTQDFDRVWVNNAGIDGCSTFGHDLLLTEHLIPLKPDMILYLIGINDLYQGLYNTQDTFLQTSREYRLRDWASKSEVFALGLTLYRSYKAVRLDITGLAQNGPPCPRKPWQNDALCIRYINLNTGRGWTLWSRKP